MTANAKLDALLARLEGGEALNRMLFDKIGMEIERADPIFNKFRFDVLTQVEAFFDAVLSLARYEREARLMFNAPRFFSSADVTEVQEMKRIPFNPEPCLRAMLIEALKARRT